MRIIGDFHTHTKASDGRGTVTQNLAEAEKRGLRYYAVADHGFSTLVCRQTQKKLKAQSDEIAKLQETSEIKIYRSLETNITGFDGKLDIDDSIIKQLDIIHFGFHRFIDSRHNGEYFNFVLRNGFASAAKRIVNRDKNTESYINAIENYPVDVLCHMSHRAFVDVKRVCEAAKSNDCYIELNEKHITTIEDDIDTILKSGVNFILASDAHKPQDIGKFPRVEQFILRHNIPLDRIVGIEMEPKFKPKK
ncbi:MAG: PHP domain-containing protein [Clostridia bacterium]|nr:PHP domain-containing protein [Clostridia bacterium]